MANAWDERKKAQEEEYFVKKEREAIEKLKSKQAAEGKEAVKAACYMICPKCGETLKESSFQRVTIDQCPGCHGVWLDAGELDQVAKREEGSWLGRLWQKSS